MIKRIEWSESFAVGEDQLDADHRQSVALINQFVDGVLAKKSRAELAALLQALLRLTRDHFQRENQLLENIKGLDKNHIAEHDNLFADLEKLSRQFEAGGAVPSPEAVAEEVKTWFFNHTVKFDAKLKGYLGG